MPAPTYKKPIQSSAPSNVYGYGPRSAPSASVPKKSEIAPPPPNVSVPPKPNVSVPPTPNVSVPPAPQVSTPSRPSIPTPKPVPMSNSGMKRGGSVKSFISTKNTASKTSSRGDGIAQRGKTRGKMI